MFLTLNKTIKNKKKWRKNVKKCLKVQNKIIIFRIKEAWNTFLAKIALYWIKGKKMQKSSTSKLQ